MYGDKRLRWRRQRFNYTSDTPYTSTNRIQPWGERDGLGKCQRSYAG